MVVVYNYKMLDLTLTLAAIVSLIWGAIAGGIRALVGWLKSGEAFNMAKFSKTLVVSMLIGIFVSFQIQNPIELMAIVIGGEVIFEDVVKGFIAAKAKSK